MSHAESTPVYLANSLLLWALQNLMKSWRLENNSCVPWCLLQVLCTTFMVSQGNSLPWEIGGGDDTHFIISTVGWWCWCCSSTHVLEHHGGLHGGTGKALSFWVPPLMLPNYMWCWNLMVISGAHFTIEQPQMVFPEPELFCTYPVCLGRQTRTQRPKLSAFQGYHLHRRRKIWTALLMAHSPPPRNQNIILLYPMFRAEASEKRLREEGWFKSSLPNTG